MIKTEDVQLQSSKYIKEFKIKVKQNKKKYKYLALKILKQLK